MAAGGLFAGIGSTVSTVDAPVSPTARIPAPREAPDGYLPATASPAPVVAASPTAASPTSTPAPTKPPARAPAPSTSARPSPAPTAAPGPAAQVVALTNEQRARHGCGPLRVDHRITAAAEGHSADMADAGYLAHDSRDGTGFDQRIRAEGYPAPGAENIARGQPDAATVVEAWMGSPGHRANILNCSLTTVGVGHDPRGNYWTQDFGR
ncbi:hypothetical protein PA7_31260 [Pseudonocardia asaccharolytica DSM 44247 = NBRC 16224]|uniref:SCP domain-containing protein n=2 Tax=Pseudonocardia asaccharolytica TaxID=54010 RepID=A0A511D3D2_9PSEU|nr:hypothetical protein PA7_31260 [Pseudonocardia asaccharolytica DSM 44247 = NBRC 16224]